MPPVCPHRDARRRGRRPGGGGSVKRGGRLRFPLVMLLVTTVGGLAQAQRAQEKSLESRFIAGLRERELFRIAEAYCLERLEEADISSARRGELTIELSRCYVAHALHADARQSEGLWEQAQAEVATFERYYAHAPEAILVRVQGALVDLARGERLRIQSELAPDPIELAEKAKAPLRSAVAGLTEACDDIEESLRAVRAGQAKGETLDRHELGSLAKNVAYEIGRGWENLAPCSAPRSPDYVHALNEAVDRYKPLSRLGTVDPLAWRGSLAMVRVLRLLDDNLAVQRGIDRLLAGDAPSWVQQLAHVEQAYLRLERDEFAEAVRTLEAERKRHDRVLPEFDLALLESYLASWEKADRTDAQEQADEFQERAERLLVLVRETHGQYWHRRGESHLARTLTALPTTGSASQLALAGQRFYRIGQIDEALAAFDRAAMLEEEEGNTGDAFAHRYTAATIRYEQQDWQDARDRYRALALGAPRDPRAAEAHRLAAHCALQAAKAQEKLSLVDYASLLEEHARTWPEESSAGESLWQLGRIRASEGRYASAVLALRSVGGEHARFAAAIQLAADCYARGFNERAAKGESFQTEAVEAARHFESVVTHASGRSDPWTEGQREAALVAAQIWIDHVRGGFDEAERVLRTAVDSSDAPAEWLLRAAPLRVVALAGMGRVAAAETVLAELGESAAEALLAMTGQLDRLTRTQSDQLRRRLAALQLQVASRLEPRLDELSDSQARTCLVSWAKAATAAGQTDNARGRFQALIRRWPRDPEILEYYGRMLTGTDDAESLKDALAVWRELSRHTESATPRWYTARYYLALTHHRLGDDEQALAIVKITEQLHPAMGGPAMKLQFTELRRSCEGS